MIAATILKKLIATDDDPIRYQLYTDEGLLLLNDFIGKEIKLEFSGKIFCKSCGRQTKKSFSQGFCYPCMQSRPEADICIVKPELCHHGEPDNPCRDEEFARTQCFQPHFLYCSLTSGVKVGITRHQNIPSRWIDQGAVAAIPVAKLPDRRTVGLVEKRLSDEGFADRVRAIEGRAQPLAVGAVTLGKYAMAVAVLIFADPGDHEATVVGHGHGDDFAVQPGRDAGPGTIGGQGVGSRGRSGGEGVEGFLVQAEESRDLPLLDCHTGTRDALQ